MAATFHPDAITDPESIRRGLFGSGYTQENLTRVGALPRKGDKPPAWELRVRATAGGPLEQLVRLFILGDAEPAPAVMAALGEAAFNQLRAAGVLATDGVAVRAEAAIIPLGDLLFLRDRPQEITGRAPADDHVLGVGGATVMAAHLTVRSPVDIAVDLGTGQGFQAVMLARHARRVIATDISPRALAFAALASRLNGAAGVECRGGSFFEPLEDVRGQVGCLVCNAPFVIAPPRSVVAFTTPMELDGAVEHLVRGVGDVLAEGGYATMTANWRHESADDWARRPAAWVNLAGGCDAMILRFSMLTARSYALRWIEETGTPKDRITPELLDQWTRYFDEKRVAVISSGVIILRRRRGENWIRAQALDFDQSLGHCGGQVERLFAASTALATLGPTDDPSGRRWRASDDLSLWQTRRMQAGAWSAASSVVRASPGFPMPVEVTEQEAAALARLRGERPARDEAGATPELILRLAEAGHIVPAEEGLR